MEKKHNKLNSRRVYKWQVIEGIVDTSNDYIKVAHEEYPLPYALLQLGRCRTVIVEYYAGEKPWYAVVQTTLAKIREEISYYILQQHTPDNWRCAVKHAKASRTVCDKIHWIWHPQDKLAQVNIECKDKNKFRTPDGIKDKQNISPAIMQFKIGKAFLDTDDLEQALTALNRSIELDNTDAEAFVFRGITLRRMKERTRAISDFDSAIELSPKCDWAYANRGFVFYLLDKHLEAIADLDRAIELDDEYAPYYANRGHVYFDRWDKGDYLLALNDYQKAIDMEPDKAEYHRYLANLFLKEGKLNLAENCLNEALEIDPGDIETFAIFAQVKDSQKRDAASI